MTDEGKAIKKGLEMCGVEYLHTLCMLHLGTVSKAASALTPIIGNKNTILVYKPPIIFLINSPVTCIGDWTIKKSPK